MALHLLIVLLSFLTLVVGCASEQAKQEVSEKPRPGDEVFDFCTPIPYYWLGGTVELNPQERVRGDWELEQYIQWSPDGSRILFNGPVSWYDGLSARWTVDLHSVDPGGAWLKEIVTSETSETWDPRRPSYDDNGSFTIWLRQIVDGSVRDPVWGDGSSMIYFDISPDSSRIAYSTCAYTEVEEKQEIDYYRWRDHLYKVISDVSDTKDAKEAEVKKGGRSWVYEYEIVVSDINGTDVKRLTENFQFDNFPAWSPDGAKVAFISYTGTYPGRRQYRTDNNLTIHTVSTGRSQENTLPRSVSVVPARLAWSPDGNRIAFAGWSYHPDYFHLSGPGVWAIRPDGSGLTRITDAASGPAWSPDGQRIAAVVPVGQGDVALYTFAADGSDPVLVTDTLPVPWRLPVQPWMGNLSWSPDGSEILLRGFGYRVPLDGSPPVDHGASSNDIMDAAWSPDGSKIAIRTNREFTALRGSEEASKDLVYVVERDGTNLRTLVEAVTPIGKRKIRLIQ